MYRATPWTLNKKSAKIRKVNKYPKRKKYTDIFTLNLFGYRFNLRKSVT